MTYPRSDLLSEDEPGLYGVVLLCARRAFLCGLDQFTGKGFDHRRSDRQSSSCGFRVSRKKRARNTVMP